MLHLRLGKLLHLALNLFCELFIKCTRIEFSNSLSIITGITLFLDEGLFILALYFIFTSTTITFSSAIFIAIVVFSVKICP